MVGLKLHHVDKGVPVQEACAENRDDEDSINDKIIENGKWFHWYAWTYTQCVDIYCSYHIQTCTST